MTIGPKLNLGCGSRYHHDPLWENIDYPGAPPIVKRVNLLNGLPYPSNTFKFIYSSHVLDHFNLSKTEFIVNEVWRCLKPDGVFRVSVPDLEFGCRRYLKSVEENANNPERHHWFMIELLDQVTRTEPGGEKARFLKAARMRPDLQTWLRPMLGSEMLQHLDQPDPVVPGGLWRVRSWIKSLLYSFRHFEKSGERHWWIYDWISLSDLLCRNRFQKVMRVSFRESQYMPYLEENLDIEDGKEYKPGSLYVEGQKL